MTIYDNASVVEKAFPLPLTPSNIIEGFDSTGIYPFISNISDESEFLSSYVTDRLQEPQRPSDVAGCSTSKKVAAGTINVLTPPSTKASTTIVAPESISPHLKAQAR